MASFPRLDSGDDVQRFFDHFMKSSGNLTSLSTLFRLAHSNNKPIVPDEVIIALESTLCDKTISSNVYDVCIGVLQEILPCDAVSFEDLSRELQNRNGGALLLLLAMQTNNQQLKLAFFKTLLMQLGPNNANDNTKLIGLKLLAQWISSDQNVISDGDVDTVAEIVKTCLGLLSGNTNKEKTKDKVVKTDGSQAPEIYTLFTMPDGVTMDYQLSVQAFSILNQLWPVIFDKKIQSVSVTELESMILAYSLKIIDEILRNSLKCEDVSFGQVAEIEAINLLAKLALIRNPLHVQALLKVSDELFLRSSSVEILLPVLQLFINLSTNDGLDITDKLNEFFDKYLVQSFSNLCSSTEIILFLKKNLTFLNSLMPSPLRIWFPNVLKIIAWHPTTFLEDFDELIPTLMDDVTSEEVLQSILDLPCTTLALIHTLEHASHARKCADTSLIHSALRKVSKTGETYCGVTNLYKSQKSTVNHQRVIASSFAMTRLLRTYFEVLLDHADEDLALNILLVILDRSIYLQEIPHQKEFLNKIFAEVVLQLFLYYPQLVLKAKTNILNFLSKINDLSLDVCVNMIWIVGEYATPSYIENISLDTLMVYYDALESKAEANLLALTSATVSVIIVTVVKILTRLPDIAPRVKLFLQRLKLSDGQRQNREDWSTVISRIEDATFAVEEANHCQESFSVDNLMRFVSAAAVDLPTRSQNVVGI
ncbi:AP-5 complex subunit zeta-1 [Chamberlinius hualienensis]